MTKDVGGARLSNGEWHSPAARVSGREVLSFPERDRIAMQIGEMRLVEKIRFDDRRVIYLTRHRPSRVPASDAWRIRAAYGVLRVVVEKPINVHPRHQVLVRRELVVNPPVEEELAVMTRKV